MRDERVEKLAGLLVNYSVAVKAGDRVFIRGSSVAEPLVKAVYKHVLQAGGLPYYWGNLPGLDEITYRYASDEQLQHIPEPYRLAFETCNVYINLLSDVNTKSLTRIDPHKMVVRSQGWRAINDLFLQRAAAGDLRWTLTLFPSHAHAQDAQMSLEEYENFVYQACLPDMNDPIGYWQKVSARQAKVVDWLKGKEKVHVVGPGTDLTLNVAGRTWINCDCHENVPDGEVFTGPLENSMQGHVTFSYPAIFGGHEVTGVRLEFVDGKVVKASADKNEDYLVRTLDTDEGSRYVGEFAIGTNEGITEFTGEILFDEKIAGSFHMALGAGYPETGSKNESSIHWDMICDLRDGGEIWVDDELLYKNGKFVIQA